MPTVHYRTDPGNGLERRTQQLCCVAENRKHRNTDETRRTIIVAQYSKHTVIGLQDNTRHNQAEVMLVLLISAQYVISTFCVATTE